MRNWTTTTTLTTTPPSALTPDEENAFVDLVKSRRAKYRAALAAGIGVKCAAGWSKRVDPCAPDPAHALHDVLEFRSSLDAAQRCSDELGRQSARNGWEMR
jgi:hypothetical protein